MLHHIIVVHKRCPLGRCAVATVTLFSKCIILLRGSQSAVAAAAELPECCLGLAVQLRRLKFESCRYRTAAAVSTRVACVASYGPVGEHPAHAIVFRVACFMSSEYYTPHVIRSFL